LPNRQDKTPPKKKKTEIKVNRTWKINRLIMIKPKCEERDTNSNKSSIKSQITRDPIGSKAA
jgi:hypothetical protein